MPMFLKTTKQLIRGVSAGDMSNSWFGLVPMGQLTPSETLLLPRTPPSLLTWRVPFTRVRISKFFQTFLGFCH